MLHRHDIVGVDLEYDRDEGPRLILRRSQSVSHALPFSHEPSPKVTGIGKNNQIGTASNLVYPSEGQAGK
jgi:hypothetical protein